MKYQYRVWDMRNSREYRYPRRGSTRATIDAQPWTIQKLIGRSWLATMHSFTTKEAAQEAKRSFEARQAKGEQL